VKHRPVENETVNNNDVQRKYRRRNDKLSKHCRNTIALLHPIKVPHCATSDIARSIFGISSRRTCRMAAPSQSSFFPKRWMPALSLDPDLTSVRRSFPVDRDKCGSGHYDEVIGSAFAVTESANEVWERESCITATTVTTTATTARASTLPQFLALACDCRELARCWFEPIGAWVCRSWAIAEYSDTRKWEVGRA
jgi:hypothetical protein